MDSDKNYKIYIKNIEFNVSKEEYIKHHKEREHSKYLRKEERKVTVLSYDEVKDNLSAEDIIADESVDVEETAINNIMIEELRKILKTLDKDELDLIDDLIYQEKSEREVAAEIGVANSTISRRRKRLLDKLRNLLER